MKKDLRLIFAICLTVFILSGCREHKRIYVSPYPNGLNFAFTITDDPDGAKLDKIEPIYGLLDRLGFKTTIACWMYKPQDLQGMPTPEEQTISETIDNQKYLEFIKIYRKKGFEIALHTVTAGNDVREVTTEGYEKFKAEFGEYPKINIMHSKNRENIYWGRGLFKNSLMRMLVSLYDRTFFSGEDPSSPYFWGDICRDKTRYVRLWGTSDINTLKFNPSMPYHDPSKSYVNYWFSFSDGYNGKYFKRLLSVKNIDKLIKERGACIVYTHFAAGFCKKQLNGTYILDEDIKNELEYLSKQKEGWFVPAGILLDRLSEIKNIQVTRSGDVIRLKNLNDKSVDAITLVSAPNISYKEDGGIEMNANEEGEIILAGLKPQEVKAITIKGCGEVTGIPKAPGLQERFRLFAERIKIMIFSHRG